MSLKATTSKLLTYLYTDSWQRADKSVLDLLLPDLSDAGKRSLISYCQKNSLIKSETIDGQRMLLLTEHGKRELELCFPVFSRKADSWSGEWLVVVFLTPPKMDPQFRYLRNFLLERHAATLVRGNYLIPSYLASDIVEEIHYSYRKEVLIFSIKKWVFGDEKSFVLDQYLLLDLHQSYSGVSNEIAGLLKKNISFSNASHQEKVEIFSVFDRLHWLLSKDIGLISYYFPELTRGIALLKQLQILIQ